MTVSGPFLLSVSIANLRELRDPLLTERPLEIVFRQQVARFYRNGTECKGPDSRAGAKHYHSDDKISHQPSPSRLY